jgi:hypothetical protein
VEIEILPFEAHYYCGYVTCSAKGMKEFDDASAPFALTFTSKTGPKRLRRQGSLPSRKEVKKIESVNETSE